MLIPPGFAAEFPVCPLIVTPETRIIMKMIRILRPLELMICFLIMKPGIICAETKFKQNTLNAGTWK
jgi:hypothetical protein